MIPQVKIKQETIIYFFYNSDVSINGLGAVKQDYLENSPVFPFSVSSLQELWQRFVVPVVSSPFLDQIPLTSCSRYLVKNLLLAGQAEAVLGRQESSCTKESLQTKQDD